MKTKEEIAALYTARSSAYSGVKQRMRNVRDHYNGDVVIPLPEIDTQEEAAVANLLAQGLDQTAMRVSSVLPDIICPPEDDTSDRSRKYASIKRKAMFGWWDQSMVDVQLAKRARQLIGYSESVTQCSFNPDLGVPVYTTRDPLMSFPANTRGVDDMNPQDCVFGFERSMEWVQDFYPDAALRFANASRHHSDQRDRPIEMIEYVDHEERVLLAMRTPLNTAGMWGDNIGEPIIVELERTPNLIGRCPVTVASRVSLDDARGQFDGILGMYQQQAKLMALEVIAVQKGIFPDTWLVGAAGEQPKIITAANGLKGDIGVIRGGTLKDMQLQPGFMTNPAIDRLERAQRLTAGIPAEYGGESSSNIRTGRRGDAVLSAVVDFTVQETQKILARQMENENEIAIAQAKAYAPNRPKSFYVNNKAAKGKVDYIPSKHFVTTNNKVSYSQAGADINNLVIGGGQRVQMGTMAKKSFMGIDPLVEDVEAESDRIVAEQLEAGLLSGLQQQAATGQIPPADIARIIKLVINDREDLAGAVEKVQREAQERQAEMASPTSPEAQPGIAQPGMGAEAGMTPPPEAGGGPPGLRELLGAIGAA